MANPEVWRDYVDAVARPSSADHHHLVRWTPPLVGWWLRTATPGQPFWVQWLPFAVAVVGFATWWATSARRERPRPETAVIPVLVGLSLFVAPYGAWEFDLVLLLVPVLAVAVKLASQPAAVPIAIGVTWLAFVNAAMLAMMLQHASSEWYVWVTPAVLSGCLVAVRLADCCRRPVPSLVAAGA